MTPTQRSALIEAGRVHDRSPQEEQYSFSPNISQRSQDLARAVRPPAATVEDRLLSRDYSREDRSPTQTYDLEIE